MSPGVYFSHTLRNNRSWLTYSAIPGDATQWVKTGPPVTTQGKLKTSGLHAFLYLAFKNLNAMDITVSCVKKRAENNM